MTTPGSSEKPTPKDTSADESGVFLSDRLHLLGAAAVLVMVLLMLPAKPLVFVWFVPWPLLFAAYVWRSRTTVNEAGIEARRGFSAPQQVPWEDFAGIRFGGATAFATRTDGSEIPLPGVSFNSLPRLAAASRGRIPDALTAGLEAADEKVVIIHRDGRQVLVDRDDPAAQAHLRAQQEVAETSESDK
ncbi:PH domain-containing protein [Corynebacterium aquilae]|uniref:Low molecular weight protein antigen 6 PH domain-containing protein n=1 Tax=Corynebacterium aquilae DSM 44791 TaxID=1431546 RepID=A0A1L7CFJ5_9CORY|nr:PH domain-containing protein [Corynebacterium aquilae]APT84607.1 hypothetical protein CAQU_05470 [Corynebacterium aquilae DSM 44791]